jgi:catechol 2,3-dioxygenase
MRTAGYTGITTMAENHIDPSARIGTVNLRVRELARAIDFYTSVLGFQVTSKDQSSAQLSAGGECLLELHQDPAARPVPGTAGLYHFAVLVPSRLELAKSLKQLIDTQTPLQGFADHLVSEAIYLADPDRNGIEIYRDRPRHEWPHRDGHLVMATDPLDVKGLLEELAGTDEEWTGLAQGSIIGHIHLQVSDLPRSIEFYEQTLGFDLILRYGPQAAFLSAGGYHHHVGINTWAGVGAPPAPSEATGLIWFTVDFPDQDSYDRYIKRLSSSSVVIEDHPQGVLLKDPSGIAVLLRAANLQKL